MRVPGIVYSLILAVGAWAVDYFTEGAGSGWLYAPVLLAIIPILLKAITVTAPPEATPRGADESKLRKFLLGG